MKSLLPAANPPQITRARVPLTSRLSNTLDAIIAVVPSTAEPRALAQLPHPESWKRLHAREQPRHSTVRSAVVPNQPETRLILGYERAGATHFERLTLAGRLLREAAARTPQTLALTALGPNASAGPAVEALLAAALAQAFAMPNFRSNPSTEKCIEHIVLVGDHDIDVRHAAAAARGNNLTRWLTALPPNKLDASNYHRLISELAKKHHLTLRWLDEGALKRVDAGAFLAVAAANAKPNAGIAHLRYRPRNRARASAPDVALVGKGILFDTGGNNLKPHDSMLNMHIDMSGSAVALSTLVALSELNAPIAADAWLAITENRIGPTAYKPQDVVRAANGVTIQVIHTDAEGRMVLADTLALAARTKPRFIIDFATLTGACVRALTDRMSGVITNRENLVDKLIAAGRASGERVWNFPFDTDYDSDLESKVADIRQCAVGSGDHILAARFLSRFVPERIPWVHVDLSSAMRTGGLAQVSTDITGFGVRYALELLLRQGLLQALGDSPNAAASAKTRGAAPNGSSKSLSSRSRDSGPRASRSHARTARTR